MFKTILPILLIVASMTACGARSTEVKGNDGTKGSSKLDETKKANKTYTISLTKEEFLNKVVDYKGNPNEWLYIGDKPAIIDFWAEWCSYCRKLAPVLEELAKEYEGQIYVYKVNTDQEKEIATAFGIRSLPTLFFAPIDGTPKVIEGAVPKTQIKKIIEEILLNETEQ
ncbi:MAG: thioredoxin [Bacteroidales bacterium]